MTIKVGDKLPAATFKVKTADGVKEMTTDEVFKGKKVVLFAVPCLHADLQPESPAGLSR